MQVERTVDTPMRRVWVVLRDYRTARPRMLTEHFADSAVQQEGERTVIDYRLRVGRHQRRYISAVEEPMAGRQLRERALHSALMITWTLTPGGDGERTAVRLAAELRNPDINGRLARRRARRALRQLYGQLLEHLNAYVAAHAT